MAGEEQPPAAAPGDHPTPSSSEDASVPSPMDSPFTYLNALSLDLYGDACYVDAVRLFYDDHGGGDEPPGPAASPFPESVTGRPD